MVSVVGNIRVKFCDARMGPVLASHGKDMPKRVGLCNCAIDIRDDDLVVVFPEEQLGSANRFALVAGCHRKCQGV